MALNIDGLIELLSWLINFVSSKSHGWPSLILLGVWFILGVSLIVWFVKSLIAKQIVLKLVPLISMQGEKTVSISRERSQLGFDLIMTLLFMNGFFSTVVPGCVLLSKLVT